MLDIKAVTFDFWGTLVDVDTSGELGMAQVLSDLGLSKADPRTLYFDWDAATVRRYRSSTWRPYFDWGLLGLRDVLTPLGVDVNQAHLNRLAETLMATMTSRAEPHPEVPAIISALKERLPLMPITNMDQRLFEMNAFKSQFTLTLTAEEARAFKPSALIFNRAIERLGVAPRNILHVSLSQFADLEGAMPVGMNVAWINRNSETLGIHTPKPLYEFHDLNGLKSVVEAAW